MSLRHHRRTPPKTTRTEVVRRQLEREILGGRFQAGTHLDEISLATRLGCSRTPVREALNQLVAVGLLERRSHCGVYVSRTDRGRIRDMVEAYVEIEILCVSMAVGRLSAPERAQLAKLCDDPRQLWAELVKACSNRTISEVADGLRAKLDAYGFGGAANRDREIEIARALSAALVSNDAQEIAAIIRRRLQIVVEGAAAAPPPAVQTHLDRQAI